MTTNFEKMVKAAGEASAVAVFELMAMDERELLRDEAAEPQAADMAMDLACEACLEYGVGADDKGADGFTSAFTEKLFALARRSAP